MPDNPRGMGASRKNGEHGKSSESAIPYVDIVGVAGSIPAAPTILTSENQGLSRFLGEGSVASRGRASRAPRKGMNHLCTRERTVPFASIWQHTDAFKALHPC